MSAFTAKSFNDFLLQGKLMGNVCSKCNYINLPPRQICLKCGSEKLEWRELSGSGFLEALTQNNLPSSSFRQRCPYYIGIVKLDDGPSISGLIISGKNDPPVVGSKVKLEIIKEGEKPILSFKTV